MDEKRLLPRQRRLKEGRLVFNGKNSVMSCLVRDANAAGVRLKCGEPYLVPQDFELTIRGEAEPRAAQRVWIKGTEMGVRFTNW